MFYPADAQKTDSELDFKWVLYSIALDYAETGQLSQAIRLAQTIDDDARSKAIALSRIARYYTEAGQPDQALIVAKTIEALSVKDYDTDWILPQIASEYAKAGQFEQALQVTQTIEGKSNKVKALTAIAGQYAARSQQEKAQEVLFQALKIVQASD